MFLVEVEVSKCPLINEVKLSKEEHRNLVNEYFTKIRNYQDDK